MRAAQASRAAFASQPLGYAEEASPPPACVNHSSGKELPVNEKEVCPGQNDQSSMLSFGPPPPYESVVS